MSLFTKPVPTREEKTATAIDTQLRNVAVAMLTAYQQIQTLVHSNAAYTDESGNCQSEAVYAAFQLHNTTGMSCEQLREFVKVIKTVVNKYAPGTIQDDLPEVTIQ
jgi:hypothetical protein